MKCSVENCTKPIYVKKKALCNTHYLRLIRYNRLDAPYKEKWYKERVNGNGYLSVRTSRGIRLIHRLAIEERLGRALNPREHVHHINGNKLDNRIENLRLVTPGEHSRIHHKPKIDWSKYIGQIKPSLPNLGSQTPKRHEICFIESCRERGRVRGLCNKHYCSYRLIVLGKKKHKSSSAPPSLS